MQVPYSEPTIFLLWERAKWSVRWQRPAAARHERAEAAWEASTFAEPRPAVTADAQRLLIDARLRGSVTARSVRLSSHPYTIGIAGCGAFFRRAAGWGRMVPARAGSGYVMHADPVEPIFVAALANDSIEIAAIADRTPGAIDRRMQQDFFVTQLPHMLYRGDTPLHLAAAGLRYDAARALLAAGTPIEAVNRRGATALHYACDPRPSSATWDPAAQRRIIDLLASRGAPVDRADRGGVTALHRAVRARSPAAVAALLSAGADPRAGTKKTGSTALHLAVAPTGASGTANAGGLQIEIVRMLLAAGATMTDVDGNGIAVVDRIKSRTLREALAAGHF